MRLPEAHTTQTAAGQCQAKLYIFIKALSRGAYICHCADICADQSTCHFSWLHCYSLYRIYFYICTEQLILIVCLSVFDWVALGLRLRLRLGNFGHGQVANDATENDNRHECAATMTTKQNATRRNETKRNGIKTWHAFKNSNKQIFYF